MFNEAWASVVYYGLFLGIAYRRLTFGDHSKQFRFLREPGYQQPDLVVRPMLGVLT